MHSRLVYIHFCLDAVAKVSPETDRISKGYVLNIY